MDTPKVHTLLKPIFGSGTPWPLEPLGQDERGGLVWKVDGFEEGGLGR